MCVCVRAHVSVDVMVCVKIHLFVHFLIQVLIVTIQLTEPLTIVNCLYK